MDEEYGSGSNLMFDSGMQQRQAGMMQVRLYNVDELTEFESKLRGADFDYTKNVWVRNHRKEALLNEQGVNKVMADIGLHANKMFYLSNFTEAEAYNLSLSATFPLLKAFALHGKQYGLRRENRNLLIEAIDNLFIAIFKRAMNDKERDHIDTVSRTVEKRTYSDQSNKGKSVNMDLTRGDATYG